MNSVMMYVGIYVLIVIAVFLTVGLAWFLIVGRSIAIKHKAFNKEFDAVTERIKKRRELNGRATDHKIDLSSFKGGGWTGKFDSKKPIDLGLNKPHPFYSKEADDEQRSG